MLGLIWDRTPALPVVSIELRQTSHLARVKHVLLSSESPSQLRSPNGVTSRSILRREGDFLSDEERLIFKLLLA